MRRAKFRSIIKDIWFFQNGNNHSQWRYSKEKADAKAEREYAIFNKTQLVISDFDKEIKRLKGE